MRTQLHLLTAILFLLLVHCEHAVDPTTFLNTRELMPLQAGNIWYYQVWAFATPFTARAEIARKVPLTIGGVSYDASAYLIPYPTNIEPPPFAWLYWNGPDGLYWLGGISPTDTLLYKTLLFKYPAEVGESWRVIRINYDDYEEKFYFDDTLTVSLVSKNEIIETPAGKFKCHVYSYRKRPADDVSVKWDYYHYYLPGLGRIAYITRSSDDQSIRDRILLSDYKVK